MCPCKSQVSVSIYGNKIKERFEHRIPSMNFSFKSYIQRVDLLDHTCDYGVGVCKRNTVLKLCNQYESSQFENIEHSEGGNRQKR